MRESRPMTLCFISNYASRFIISMAAATAAGGDDDSDANLFPLLLNSPECLVEALLQYMHIILLYVW